MQPGAPEGVQARDQAGAQAQPQAGVCGGAQGGLLQAPGKPQEGQEARHQEVVLSTLTGVRADWLIIHSVKHLVKCESQTKIKYSYKTGENKLNLKNPLNQ